LNKTKPFAKLKLVTPLSRNCNFKTKDHNCNQKKRIVLDLVNLKKFTKLFITFSPTKKIINLLMSLFLVILNFFFRLWRPCLFCSKKESNIFQRCWLPNLMYGRLIRSNDDFSFFQNKKNRCSSRNFKY
jgi:hypothetical protein